MKGEKEKMISMIQVLLLSYINKYGRVNIDEIRIVVNEPINLIAREIVLLHSEGYLEKKENKYKLTKKGLQENIPSWDVWVDNVNNVMGDEKDFPVKLNDVGVPCIDSVKDLYRNFDLEHINKQAYHIFNISKGFKNRQITAPSKNLKLRQRWILKHILNEVNLPDCVHGFVRGKSIVSNAKCHINKREIGCIDIKDFFPSISVNRVVKVFKDLKFDDEVASELGVLCTFNRVLPQGAPTSPMLANIIFKQIDLEILKYTENRELTYSRYADDITISGDIDIQNYICEIKEIISKYGFKINENKTHIMKNNYRKIVTGLVVSDKVRVPRKFKRKLRQEIYYCQKFGVEQHLKNIGRTSAVNFKEHMYGKAYFIKMVEKKEGENFLKKLDDIFSISN